LTNASSFAAGAEKRWTNLIEDIGKNLYASRMSLSKQEPLVKYLEYETRMSNIMPEGFRYVSAELLELQNAEVEARESISEVEEIIETKNIDKFLQLEDSFEKHKAAKERLAHMTDLHEDFLFEHFLPVLCLPGSKSTFENFE
jgi:hypothetical protein